MCMLNFNHCHCMCEIFNKRHKMPVANAPSTADCKAKANLVGSQTTDISASSKIKTLRKRNLHFLPQKSMNTKMLTKKDLASGEHKTGCLAAERHVGMFHQRQELHHQKGSYSSLQTELFKSPQSSLQILSPEGAFFFCISLNKAFQLQEIH